MSENGHRRHKVFLQEADLIFWDGLVNADVHQEYFDEVGRGDFDDESATPMTAFQHGHRKLRAKEAGGR